MTYKRFQSIVSTMEPPPHPVDTITANDIEGMDTAITPDHSDKYGIPTLEELGKDSFHLLLIYQMIYPIAI